MTLKAKISAFRQFSMGILEKKVLRYDGDQQIEHDDDLIHKGYLKPMENQLNELLPPDADPLTHVVLSGATLHDGYLSQDALAVYEAGKPAGSMVSYIVNDADFTLITPNATTAINGGDKGKLELWINGTMTDEFDLAARFNEVNRDTAQAGLPEASAGGQITVTSIEKYAITLWQKVNAVVTITASDLVRGYNEIILKHTDVDGADQVSQATKLFYDTETDSPTVTAVVLSIHSNSSPKHLSGVKYLGSADEVKVSLIGHKLFDNTYVASPVVLSGLHGAPTTSIAPTDGAVSGLSVPPVVGETMTVTDKVVVLSVGNKCTADGRITGTPKDPFGSYSGVKSPSQKLLISTFAARSNDTTEHFDDENYRLPLSFDSDATSGAVTGHWDSAVLLANGDAQLFVVGNNEHGLMYPAQDFTPYLPANAADYSGFSGDQQYMRAFLAGSPKASIQFQLVGVTGGIGQVGSGDMNVEVKLPGQTGWLDCAKPFDGSAGVGTDGLGAMVGSISYSGGKATLNATFGGKSSYDAGGRCLIRITLRNANRSVKQIVTNW